MQLIGLARLGRDAELKTTQSGESVASLSLAFSYGRKGQDGKRPTQWVDGSLWGKRAESLAPYLLKGTAVVVTLDDPHIEEFQGRNGPGFKLAATVSNIEFAGESVGGTQQQRQAAPTPAPAPRPPARAPMPTKASSEFDEIDDIAF